MLIVKSNGGSRQLPPDELVRILGMYPLDSTFEYYGGFFCVNPISRWNRQPLYPDNPGTVSFYGNFIGFSWGFHIDTDEPYWIERIKAAIAQNQKSEAYLAQGKNRVCCIAPDYPPTFVTSKRVGEDVLVCESFYFDTANRYLLNGVQVGKSVYYKRLRQRQR